MKIKSVRIENLRSYKDETIYFNDYSCIVGPNGAGKSNILCALNIFFRSNNNSPTSLVNLSAEDFYSKDTSNPIKITVTFHHLNEEAKKEFGAYFRQDQLVISAIASFDEESKTADVKQYGSRLANSDFAVFFEGQKKVADLTIVYKDLQKKYTDLPDAKTKVDMTEGLRKYEESHPETCQIIESEDQFYGFTKGSSLLGKFIQWVHIPAVKDATTEQSEGRNALADLLARTVRSKQNNLGERIKTLTEEIRAEYSTILDENKDVLDEISASLNIKVKEWSHPDASLRLDWRMENNSIKVPEPFAQIIAGEKGFEGELSRFGHGFQRSYLFSLLQVLSECSVAVDPDGNSVLPTLILGCEEPELFQHPPQAKHLASVLQLLSEKDAQIILCTHSPYFVSGKGFEDIRLVRNEMGGSKISRCGIEDIGNAIAKAKGERLPEKSETMRRLHQALQPGLNEMFFNSHLVLVEGIEDSAYLTTYFHLMKKWDHLRKFGCSIIPVNGKEEMLRPIAIAKNLQIPVFVLFDGDSAKKDQAKLDRGEVAPDKIDEFKRKLKSKTDENKSRNRALLALCGDSNTELPAKDYWGASVVVWEYDIRSTVQSEIDIQEWSAGKNVIQIGEKLAEAWGEDKRSTSLQKLCLKIIEFCDPSNHSRQ